MSVAESTFIPAKYTPPFKPQVMMDSGAFSVWTLKKPPIDVSKYCDFLHEHKDWIDVAIVLDVIIPDDAEEAARLSFENFKYMRSRGLAPMPVFHQGEDMKWLRKYLDEGCTYIGLSGTSMMKRPELKFWYEIVWPHLINKDGYPIVRAHALGITREPMLDGFPWASSDSTSWIYYALITTKFAVDDKSLSQRWDREQSKALKDIDRISPLERDQVRELLIKRGMKPECLDERPIAPAGLGRRYDTEDQIKSDRLRMARAYLMLKHQQEMETRLNKLVPARYEPRPGFIANHPEPSDRPMDPKYNSFAIWFVAGTDPLAYPLLRQARQEKMLVSYYSLRSERIQTPMAMHYLTGYLRDPHNWCYNSSPHIVRNAIALDNVFVKNPLEEEHRA